MSSLTPEHPLYALYTHKEQFALEAFDPSAMVNSFKTLISDVAQAFKNSTALHVKDKVEKLNKDQTKFLKITSAVPYGELSELTAYKPEGMICTYLEYLTALLPVVTYVKGIHQNVVQPYSLFLARFVSDKNTSMSSDNQKIQLTTIESRREAIHKSLGALFSKSNSSGTCKVKNVISRNADWKDVFVMLNKVIDEIDAIDLKKLNSEVTLCAQYLDLILKAALADEGKAVSPETAHRLSNEAYNVASELELLASIHYRVLTVRGTVENTVKHIEKCMG